MATQVKEQSAASQAPGAEEDIPGNRWRQLLRMTRFCAWMMYVSLGVVMLGFDWSCYPQLLAMPTFAEQFGYFDESAGIHIVSSDRQGVWNGASSGAQVVGGLVSGFVMDKIGRRWWLLAMTLLGVVSIGIVYASPNWQVLAVGRALQGFSVGATMTFSPVYIGEASLPELRGFFLVCFNTFIVVGQFLVTLVCRATVDLETNWQWRIPVLTMFIFPGIVLAFMPWFPESPFFLLNHNNDREACHKALTRLYGPGHDDMVEVQIQRMESGIQSARVLMQSGQKSNYLALFRGHNLKRTIAAFLAPAAQVLSGVVFVVGYLPYFLTLVGIDNVFNWNMYLFTISLVANFSSFWIVERFGRRKFIVYGLFILATIMLIVGGLNVNPSRERYLVTIGLIYVWIAVFQTSIGPLGYTLASEIATLSLRSETQGIVTMANSLCGWVFSFSVPYMINPDAGNLGGRVGFIFGGLGLVCAILGFFLFPETQGMTFAELDWLYSNKVQPWNFAKAVENKRATGTGDFEGSAKERSREEIEATHVEDSP